MVRRFRATCSAIFFTAQFNARKVVRHNLVTHGSTFRTRDQDFVTTDDPDFHPSDVLESADGSLIVIDTGSWYVQHCPTGRIRDVHAPGGIYRVRYAAAPVMDDPWGRRLNMDRMSPEQLADYLDDPRPPVRERSVRALAAAGAESVSVLAGSLERARSLEMIRRAIWSLAANPDKSALIPLRKLLAESDPAILIPAARAIAMRGDTQSSAALERLLTLNPKSIRIAAAEALARVGSPSAIPAIWQVLGDAKNDPHLDHALDPCRPPARGFCQLATGPAKPESKSAAGRAGSVRPTSSPAEVFGP